MPLWSSGVTWSSGALWSPAAPPPDPSPPEQGNLKSNRSTMKRQNYYPRILAQRPEWHSNFAAKLIHYAAQLPLTAAQTDNGVADNLTLYYGLGDWITKVRELGPAATANLRDLEEGTGSAAFAFITFEPPEPPTLPAGALPVKPGALRRVFKLVQVIKGLPGYTEAIGLDMGIVGSEAPETPPTDAPPPDITVKAVSGTSHQFAQIKFIKNGHEYLVVESRRNGGPWEQVGMSNKSPFTDTRPLLTADQAEIRDYRARYFDDGEPTSDWSPVSRVTISPS